jgi:hypothetical protein
MTLGARTVLSSVFPLKALTAAVFAARLVFRVSEYLSAAIALFERGLNWTEVVSGMLRMQLLTDFLLLLVGKKLIEWDIYEEVHMTGNNAINGGAAEPFRVVLDDLEGRGFSRKSLEADLEMAVATSSAISYIQIGRPETILIDNRERVVEQLKQMDQSITD